MYMKTCIYLSIYLYIFIAAFFIIMKTENYKYPSTENVFINYDIFRQWNIK